MDEVVTNLVVNHFYEKEVKMKVQKRRNSFVVLAVIVATMFVAACAGGFVKNSFRTLSVSQNTYDATMSSLASLYREGKITVAEKNKIIEYGTLYYQAHNEAVAALGKYAASDYKDEAAKQAYMDLAVDVSTRLAKLIALIESYNLGSSINKIDVPGRGFGVNIR